MVEIGSLPCYALIVPRDAAGDLFGDGPLPLLDKKCATGRETIDVRKNGQQCV